MRTLVPPPPEIDDLLRWAKYEKPAPNGRFLLRPLDPMSREALQERLLHPVDPTGRPIAWRHPYLIMLAESGRYYPDEAAERAAFDNFNDFLRRHKFE